MKWFRTKAGTLVGVLHALGTWAIVGLSIWAIWWSDFGEHAATLLKTEIIEERNKVNELRREATVLQQILTDKEIALQNYDQKSRDLERQIRKYEAEVASLEKTIEGHVERLVNDSLRSWSAKAGAWMAGHKIRAEIASKWDEHVAWMNELREWSKGAPIPSSMPYIWNFGLMKEHGRGSWSVRTLVMEDCKAEAEEEGIAVVEDKHELSLVGEWLRCGEVFERDFMNAVTHVERDGIYTVSHLLDGMKQTLADDSESEEVEACRRRRLGRVLEEYGISDSMPLRLQLQRDVEAEKIVAEGKAILANYDIFEAALEALRRGQ